METQQFEPEPDTWANKVENCKHNPEVKEDTEPRKHLFDFHKALIDYMNKYENGNEYCIKL